jgi:hypothetical protein
MKSLASILVLCLCLCLAACGGAFRNQTSSIAGSSNDKSVFMYVLFPPAQHATYFNALQTYVISNPAVSGANFAVPWSDIDQGPGASPQYVWTSIDDQLQPWMAAGKKVNIIVWPVSYGATNTATPGYVLQDLGTVNTTTCNGETIPNYFAAAFQTPYRAFMAQVVQHFSSNASVGYIRFGLAQGGESFPALGFDQDPICSNAFKGSSGWGWTTTGWTNYLTSMLDYEKSLASPKQLMVGINLVENDLNIPNAVAAKAVANGIGFGNQGLQLNDSVHFNAGQPCQGNWCALFNRYSGQVPLELQTVSQSDPSGGPPVGSLADLLPFAVSQHANVFEIYWEDWLVAYDPAFPGYSQYHVAYSQAVEHTANAVVTFQEQPASTTESGSDRERTAGVASTSRK